MDLVEDAERIDLRAVLRRRRGRFTVNGRVVDLGRRARRWLDDAVLGSVGSRLRVDLDNLVLEVAPAGEPTQRLELVTDQPHFGGERFWLLCPDCKRRIAIVYRASRGERLRCRRCCKLIYESTSLDKDERARRKMLRLRERIGGEAHLFGFVPPKPRGAHAARWARDVAALREAERAHLKASDAAVRRALGVHRAT